jgi:hypothetical protein
LAVRDGEASADTHLASPNFFIGKEVKGMAIRGTSEAGAVSAQGTGLEVGAREAGERDGSGGRGGAAGMERRSGSALTAQDVTKILKPLPHAVIDYAWAGTMMAAPWLFGFSRNRKAT